MVDLLMGLNNFSKSIEEINEGFIDKKGELPKELPFIDLLPLSIPPPPFSENGEEDGETKPIRKFKNQKTISEIGKNIIELNESIIKKIDNTNGILQEQKQSLKYLNNQTLISNLPQIDPSYENILSQKNLGYQDQTILEKKREYVISDKNIELPNLQIDLPKLENLKLSVDYDNLLNLDNLNIPIKITEYISSQKDNLYTPNSVIIPTKFDVPNIPNFSRTDFINIYYNIEKKPFIDTSEINIPINYKENYTPKNYDIKPINVPIIVDREFDFKTSNLEPIIQTVDIKNPNYNNIEKNIRIGVGYDYEKLSIDNPSLSQEVSMVPNFKYLSNLYFDAQESVQIPVNYKIDAYNLDLPKSELFGNRVIDSKFEIVKNYKINDDFDFDRIPNNFYDRYSSITENATKYLTKKLYEFENSVNNIFSQDYKFPTIEKERYNLDNYQISDGFVETINNVSNFLYDFIDKFDNVESYNLVDPIGQVTNNIFKSNSSPNDLNTSLDFGKMNLINKVSLPSIMMSSLDPKQFNSLLETIEKNSNIISETFKDKKSSTNSNFGSNSIINVPISKQEEPKNDTNEKMLKVMSNLDDKMGLMIEALSNISTWVNENRSTSTSLRPYKH
jgi:hypothetical protein